MPFKNDPLNGNWIFGLVLADKMLVAAVREELVKCGKGVYRRLVDLERMERGIDEARVAARVQEVHDRIRVTSCKFRGLLAVSAWLEGASPQYQRRTRFLVLEGPSGVGKMEFAKSLLGVERARWG